VKGKTKPLKKQKNQEKKRTIASGVHFQNQRKKVQKKAPGILEEEPNLPMGMP